jgi:hypothetical protein
VPIAIIDVARPPDECWRALTDPSLFPAWMPGLRKAEVLSREPGGLPHEVHFERSASLVYSLVYSYDLATRTIRWEPHEHVRDAVRGFIRIDPHPDGARLTCKLEQGAGRKTGDLSLGSAQTILGAFAHWLESR